MFFKIALSFYDTECVQYALKFINSILHYSFEILLISSSKASTLNIT